MTLPTIAGLIAAIAFAVLVALLAVPLLKLGGLIDEARESVRSLTDHATPILDEARESVRTANVQLAKVDEMTTPVAEAAQNISAITTLVSATVARPLIKVAAYSEAVRRVVFRRRPRA